jgi:CDP-diacylglycerol pyrophosphatase
MPPSWQRCSMRPSPAPEPPQGVAAAALALGVVLALAAAPARAGRDDLRLIVQQQCVPHWIQQHDPAPCKEIDIPGGEEALFGASVRRALAAGWAVLADRKGGAHLLLVPLTTMSGIESPQLLESSATNYFAAAWNARARIATAAGRPLAPEQLGLAVNSRYSRGQDQLHIHMECQGAALHAALLAQAAHLSTHWSALEVAGERYEARRVLGASLNTVRPFELLAAGVPGARADMAAYTLVVAGARFADGPGFALLARRAVLRGGERLLDASCAIAQ